MVFVDLCENEIADMVESFSIAMETVAAGY